MRRIAPTLLVIAALAGLIGPVRAQEASLGGGSDIPAGTVVDVAAGTTIPPVHHVFADNPETETIEVEFRADTPAGIAITPEQTQFPIAAGESVTDHFSIDVDETVAAGDYQVSVQLVRSDITPEAGQITNVPAVGTTFTVRVVGDAATITVQARSEQSGQPVAGTLTLAAITGPAATFEIARAEDTQLSARVAPGDYRAAYLLAGRELAATEASVAAGDTEAVVLEVRSVSFVLVTVRPIEEDGTVVVADLVASIENHLQPLDGPITIDATIHRDGGELDTIALDRLDTLPLGVTEAAVTYRPPRGFTEGTYQFVFTITTPEFTLLAPDEPRFEVTGDDPLPIAAIGAAAAAAGAVIASAAGWHLLHRRPRRFTF